MQEEYKNSVILVDENDNPIGLMEKIQAHKENRLHRAFSIFIFNSKGEIMLQQRALSKYHCPGLWTNTCCSHPRLSESPVEAGERRLKEEMGFSTALEEVLLFQYQTDFDNGLSENEVDHVLFGLYDNDPDINKEEAESWKWISIKDVLESIEKQPEKYTYWFKVALDKLQKAKIITVK